MTNILTKEDFLSVAGPCLKQARLLVEMADHFGISEDGKGPAVFLKEAQAAADALFTSAEDAKNLVGRATI